MASTRYVTINGRRVIDPRSTRSWRVLRDQVVREEPRCWLRLARCTHLSTTGDHVIPVTVRPELALVRSNVRGACANCNDDRGSLPIEALRLGSDAPASALGIFG